MSERCPIPEGGMSRIMLSCMATCEERWDEAVRKGKVDGDYGTYEEQPYDEEESSQCKHDDVQFAHDAIHALGKHLRSYVIVDECTGCGTELGEQGYLFFCPLGSE